MAEQMVSGGTAEMAMGCHRHAGAGQPQLLPAPCISAMPGGVILSEAATTDIGFVPS
ncbi:hypothetical protein ACTMU2_26855 [Cupriavidus basilensis]